MDYKSRFLDHSYYFWSSLGWLFAHIVYIFSSSYCILPIKLQCFS